MKVIAGQMFVLVAMACACAKPDMPVMTPIAAPMSGENADATRVAQSEASDVAVVFSMPESSLTATIEWTGSEGLARSARLRTSDGLVSREVEVPVVELSNIQRDWMNVVAAIGNGIPPWQPEPDEFVQCIEIRWKNGLLSRSAQACGLIATVESALKDSSLARKHFELVVRPGVLPRKYLFQHILGPRDSDHGWYRK
ncbi:MAG: hypothetical protein SF069_16755 [Phycisphaerae bacterium]|nr:hypothetical protein [Phycisphaerae bacterium]